MDVNRGGICSQYLEESRPAQDNAEGRPPAKVINASSSQQKPAEHEFQIIVINDQS
jgi:hypothetical protein